MPPDRADYKHEWYIKHRDRILEKQHMLREINPEKCHAIENGKYYKYGGYPPKCACCGEDNIFFLGFDHINNDGAEFRKKFGSGAARLAYWLRRNNYPDGFQILCHNCNFAKGHYGICPHLLDLEDIV